MLNRSGYRKLVSKVLEVPEEDILPLQDVDLTIIDRAIVAIGSRYCSILSLRFDLGFWGEKQTLRKIAKRSGVSPEWVRQLEARALTKLRHPGRIGNFQRFSKTGLEIQKKMKETPLLEIDVEYFEPSTRILNALNAVGVRTLGELVRKTERDMIKIRGFGRKSLTELKELLLGLDLDFAPDEHCRR